MAAAHAATIISPRQLAVFVQLLAEADAGDVWRGKFETLAARLGVSWSSVARAFAELQRAQLVTKLSDDRRGASWRVVWQFCYSTCAMASPPDPPGLILKSVEIANDPPPPKSARQRVAVDSSASLDAAEHARRAAALESVTDRHTRATLAANHSGEEIAQALKMVAKSRTARDPGALLVHVLRSGAARAELETAKEKELVKMERTREHEARMKTREQAARTAASQAHAERATARALILSASEAAIRRAVGDALELSGMFRALFATAKMAQATTPALVAWILAGPPQLFAVVKHLEELKNACADSDDV